MRAAVLGATVVVALGGCGGGDSKPKQSAGQTSKPATTASAPAPTSTAPAPASRTPARRPGARPITQQQALAYQVGTPRAVVLKRAGPPLPVDQYALTPNERRNCDYYPFASQPVSYDNVFRFCFKHGRLFSVSTAPSRRAAGPGAGAPSPGKTRNRVHRSPQKARRLGPKPKGGNKVHPSPSQKGRRLGPTH